jgi:hypothetical protein
VNLKGGAARQLPVIVRTTLEVGRAFSIGPANCLAISVSYCGSVATDRSGRYLAVTSPRGSTVLICDLENGTVNAMRNATDVCGATRSVTGNGFILSSGTGRLTRWSGAPATLSSRTDLRWDNHIYPAAV